MSEQEIIEEGNKIILEFIKDQKNPLNNIEGFYTTHPMIEWISYKNKYEFQFHKSWDWLMPIVDQIHNLEEEYPVVKNNFHIWIMKRFVRIIYDYDGYCIDPDKLNDETFKRFDAASKDYRYIIFDNKPIYATFCGIVDFLKWFKEQK